MIYSQINVDLLIGGPLGEGTIFCDGWAFTLSFAEGFRGRHLRQRMLRFINLWLPTFDSPPLAEPRRSLDPKKLPNQ